MTMLHKACAFNWSAFARDELRSVLLGLSCEVNRTICVFKISGPDRRTPLRPQRGGSDRCSSMGAPQYRLYVTF
jgi:hypothetical protein